MFLELLQYISIHPPDKLLLSKIKVSITILATVIALIEKWVFLPFNKNKPITINNNFVSHTLQ